ncbi:MAG: hypothetical protein QGG36_28715, partial [Pirellulaceae bacterium]|nr:hypothetical protein [Pirellulaceae bacterium]
PHAPPTLGSPGHQPGPTPPAAEAVVHALAFSIALARGPASVERGGAGPRECGTLDAAATFGSPVLKHGPMPPAAEEGVNALGFWNAVARGSASVERVGAGRRGNGTLVAAGSSGSPVLKHGPMPLAAEEGVNALGFWNAVARGSASVERVGAGRRGNGTLVAAATSGSPVLKHGPMPPAAEEGVNALGFWNAAARWQEEQQDPPELDLGRD